MNIGIKFCGGCNPRYNRKEFLKKIMHKYSDNQYSFASAGSNYDILIVIGGCSNCCASYEQYNYDKLLMFSDSKQFPEDGLI